MKPKTYEEKEKLAEEYLDKLNFDWLPLNVPPQCVEKMRDILMRHTKQDFIAGIERRERRKK
jgi:hypothetical protein